MSEDEDVEVKFASQVKFEYYFSEEGKKEWEMVLI